MKFLTLPDRDVDQRFVSRLGWDIDPEVIRHPSGRLWILTDDLSDWMVRDLSDGTRIAVPDANSNPVIATKVEGLAPHTSVDDIASDLTLHTFLLASTNGRQRLQGSLSTERQLIWGVIHGVTLASNSLHVLREMARPRVDERWLALSLVKSLPIHSFAPWTPWHGLSSLGIGEWLRIDAQGSARPVRWWTPPASGEDFVSSAEAVRASLREALCETVRGSGRRVSADLSGGLDSTSLCFLLADLGVEFTTYRTSSMSSWNDETTRAREVAGDLRLPLHEFAPLAEQSTAFDLDPDPNPASISEGPLVWAASRGYLDLLVKEVGRTGAHVHFTGLGGDELFDLVPGLFRALRQENPLTALRQMRKFQLGQKLHLVPLLKGAFSRESYQSYFTRIATSIERDIPSRPEDAYSWFPPVVLPHWLTAKAKDLIVEAFSDVAKSTPEPLGRDPLAHQTVESIAFQGKILRQFSEIYRQYEVRWCAPYTDIRVVRAVLNAPASARISDSVDKPLLAATLDHIAPRGFYDKRGRGDFTSDIYAEHQSRRDQLLTEFKDSRLVERGIVERDRIEPVLVEPAAADVGLLELEKLVTAERWLRAVD
ncbi:asparagine synthase-related protein [Streptosporangium sp. NPDC051023]|uniref:asparagine synthase-related protein n=1 Tax=Streptosporangium sp. NPDC051023 TaxID=3155410 RepID=UPI00344ECB74